MSTKSLSITRAQADPQAQRKLLALLGVRSIEEAVRVIQTAATSPASGKKLPPARAPPHASIDLTDPLRLVRTKELAGLLGVHVVTISKWVRSGRLPKPVKLGNNVSAWRAVDLREWIDQQAEAAR